MASVWRAEDQVLERPVAVKVLSDTIASDPGFLARFRREARLAASLSHPNLIGIFDYAEGVEQPYLVMEYVAGPNLSERLARGVELDCERLARELLGAVAHIHAAGVVHRDIKPQNVLIAPDGSAKLIDFGIALPADATALTQTGHLLGTARYLAPEVMSGEVATERSDLYSCGVLLRDCLGENAPAHLRTLADRLASTDPRARPASAEAVVARLGQDAGKLEQPTERLPAALLPSGPDADGSRSPWTAIAAALAGAVALVVAAALIFGGSEEPGNRSAAKPTTKATKEATGVRDSDTRPVAPPVENPAPAEDDPELGSALNQEGFAMIQAGRPEEAVPVLEEAVEAFPADSDELDYAYALFNLGNALRLSGRPEEAIPILERRLEIPNQTATVREELEAAKSEAG